MIRDQLEQFASIVASAVQSIVYKRVVTDLEKKCKNGWIEFQEVLDSIQAAQVFDLFDEPRVQERLNELFPQPKGQLWGEMQWLRHSKYFEKYILPDWMARHPEEAMQIIQRVRQDADAEAEIQSHFAKAGYKPQTGLRLLKPRKESE